LVKWGVHSLLWTERFDIDPAPVAEKARRFGFDGIEIYVAPAQIDTFNIDGVKRALRDFKLECIGCTCLDEKTDVTSSNEATRKKGIRHLQKCAELFSELGAKMVSGVTYGAWGKLTGTGPTEQEWAHSVESLKEACQVAAASAITFGVEPANRFETYVLNTASDAVRLAKDVNEPNIGVHLDTFHMNIEEKSYYAPIATTGDLLCYMHCCENDRGIAGTGHIDWNAAFRALADIHYDKWITLESFTPEIKSVAASTAIWRQVAPSADAIAYEGLKFLKSMNRKHADKM
jgi:D-psicose/D-tagatose/L-ribulose 3-epimerase